MRIQVSGNYVTVIPGWQAKVKLLTNKKFRTEAHRGVIDAGRKTKTQVQRAVNRQMALKPGMYTGYVVANTRGIPRSAALSYEIFGVKGGIKVENYKGLRALRPGGVAAGRMNAGRSDADKGYVRSGVWNNPRTFKRSFAENGGYFAMLPGTRKTAPKALWTFGLKPNQPRSGDGKFAASNRTYGPIRRLFGPSLMKEIPKDQSLATFHKVAPPLMKQHVEKRIAKFMRF